MKAPWAGRTGAAKIAVWSATVLGVSLGLCRANFAAMHKGLVVFDGPQPVGWRGTLGSIVIWTGLLEGLGILVGAMGLLVAFVVWLLEIARKERNPE